MVRMLPALGPHDSAEPVLSGLPLRRQAAAVAFACGVGVGSSSAFPLPCDPTCPLQPREGVPPAGRWGFLLLPPWTCVRGEEVGTKAGSSCLLLGPRRVVLALPGQQGEAAGRSAGEWGGSWSPGKREFRASGQPAVAPGRSWE